jgi:hypothetical protein
MSLVADGRRIVCDGNNCRESTCVPVALPQLNGKGGPRKKDPAAEWLYVRMNGVWMHYCPKCAHIFRTEHLDASEPFAPEG